MRSFFSSIWEVTKIVAIALLIVLPIRTFVFQPFFVKGQSMEPSFENGDYLIIDELSYHLRTPDRGEVVVFKYPHDPSQRYIKRIIGLPGETIEVQNGQVAVSNAQGERVLNESNYLPTGVFTPGAIKITLEPDQYFVLGDNRPASSDSRVWGVLPQKDIIGRVVVRAWPFASLAKFGVPAY